MAKTVVSCAQCGKETTNKKFCSMSCAATFNNARPDVRRRELQGSCGVCGIPIHVAWTYCEDHRGHRKPSAWDQAEADAQQVWDETVNGRTRDAEQVWESTGFLAGQLTNRLLGLDPDVSLSRGRASELKWEIEDYIRDGIVHAMANVLVNMRANNDDLGEVAAGVLAERQREEDEAQARRDAMTPEERAEHDAAFAELIKALGGQQ